MSQLRPDVRRFPSRYDGFCHACGNDHIRRGDQIVWHGRGQGSSSVRCYDRRKPALPKGPRVADAWTREAQAIAGTPSDMFRHEQPGAYAEMIQVEREMERAYFNGEIERELEILERMASRRGDR